MSSIFFLPSVYAHTMNGFFLLVGLTLLVLYYKKIITLEPFKLLILVFIISIAVGIHGISHLGLEQSYDYNPMNLINLTLQ
jgi:tetrahydromethanopterin S-methyltransferase subunit E